MLMQLMDMKYGVSLFQVMTDILLFKTVYMHVYVLSWLGFFIVRMFLTSRVVGDYS